MLFLILACTKPHIAADTPVVIGVISPSTGALAELGAELEAGVKLAAHDAAGLSVEVLLRDDRSDPDAAAAAARDLVDDHAQALIGEIVSAHTMRVAVVAQELHVPLVAPTATHASLTAVGDQVFRSCLTDGQLGAAIARYATEVLGLRRFSLLSDGTAYAQAVEAGFRGALRVGDVVVVQRYDAGQTSFASEVAAAQDAEVDAVFVPGVYDDVAQLAIDMQQRGLRVPLLGADGFDSEQLVGLGGSAVDGATYANHAAIDDPNSEWVGFAGRFRAATGRAPSTIAAVSYDAALLAVDAVRRADGGDVAAALAATEGSLGATGPIKFGPERNPEKRAVIVQIVHGVPTWIGDVGP